jgi:hypothetical protein
MPWTAGSQAADANIAKVFMEGVLHTALTAVYTYVEEVVSTTKVARVYKSPGASNYFGQDWFLITYRPTDTNAGVSFTACELYDSVGHLCKNYVPFTQSQVPAATTYAVPDATGKNPASSTSAASGLFAQGVTLSVSGFPYWISVTPDRAVLATRIATTDYAIYTGLIDDLVSPTISGFPLAVTTLHAISNSGRMSREPGQTANSSANWDTPLYTGAGSSIWTPLWNPDIYTGKPAIARAVLSSSRGATRGLLRDVWVTPFVGSNGDTVTATIGGSAKTLVQTRNSTTSIVYFTDSSV